MRVRLNSRKLAEIIAQSPMTQNRWAQKLSLSRGHLSDLINGRHVYPSPRTREKLLRGLGVEFEELFTIEMPAGASSPEEPPGWSISLPTVDFSNTGTVMTSLFWDIRNALRGLIRKPAYSLMVFLTLSLGLGLNATVFTLVSGILLRSLPFPEAQRIVVLYRTGDTEADVSIPDGEDLRKNVSSFQQLSLFIPYRQFDLVGEGDPVALPGSGVDQEFFSVMGVNPLLGRFPSPQENQPNGPKVVVIGAGLWERRFGSSADVIGKVLSLNEQRFTIIGVAPRELGMITPVELWLPLSLVAGFGLDNRGTNNLEALARLRPEASLQAANQELDQITRRLAEMYPTTNRTKILEAAPLQEYMVRDYKVSLLLLQASVFLVLLIVCVNLASLQLVRSTGRQGETALRLALGGTRFHLLTRPLTEVLALGGAGVVGAMLLSRLGVPLLLTLAPVQLPLFEQLVPDGRVFWFSALSALLVSVIVGLAPALLASKLPPAELLRGGLTRATTRKRHRLLLDSVVVAEVALAFLLVVGAGLLIRTLGALQDVQLGFETHDRLVASLSLPQSRYNEIGKQTNAFQGMLEQLDAQPGIESAAFVIGAPLAQYGSIGNRVRRRDRPDIPPGETPGARLRPVLGPYFATVGIRLLQGRNFQVGDREGSPPVAIVNQQAAERFWPDQNPIGQEIALGAQGPARWMEVVGVVSDVRGASLASDDSIAVYTPYRQRDQEWQAFGSLVIKCSPNVKGIEDEVKTAIWAVDPALPIPSIVTMDQLQTDAMAREFFLSRLLGIFALIAILVALQGVYAVLSFRVSQQRHEIGIRKALGASEFRVLWLIVSRGLLIILLGLGVGMLGAGGLSNLLNGLLYQVSPHDLETYSIAFAGMILASLLALAVPALRASRLSTVRILQAEG